jgi:hypothetical protein
MSRSYTPLPPSAFVACSGTALAFNVKGSDHLGYLVGYLGANRRISSKHISSKHRRDCGLDSCGSGYSPVAGSREHFFFSPEGVVGLVPKRGYLLTLTYYASPR